MIITRDIFPRPPVCAVCDRRLAYGEQAGSTSYGDADDIPIVLLTCLADAGLLPAEEAR